jgi:hypothetical protein
MNANSAFQIGHDHIICEDYALAKVEAGLAYAIVCDGCSASPDVDFGARAMAHSAKRTLKLDTNYGSEKFGEITIRNAARVFDVFPHLHPQALDTTLLVTWVDYKKAYVYMYGDGVFVHKSKDKVDMIHINLSSGAPDYLSYSLDTTRIDSYTKLVDNKKLVWTNMEVPIKLVPFEPLVYMTIVEEGDIVAVISDGINSFKKADGAGLDWKDLISEFTGFKNFEGEFVQRRLSAFKRKCIKDGMTHGDDISIAAIIV